MRCRFFNGNSYINFTIKLLTLSLYHRYLSCNSIIIPNNLDSLNATSRSLLLLRFSSWFGVSDTSLLWFQSNLPSRSFSVKPASNYSQPFTLSRGVPEDTVLGSLLFIFYTTLLSHLIKSSSVDHHIYANDYFSSHYRSAPLSLLLNYSMWSV